MNKRQITKALSTAAFTPGKLGPMKVIADVGNINYYIRRATEFLTLSLTALTRDQRVKYFDSALGLIALAKVKTQEVTVEKTPSPDKDFVRRHGLGYTPGSVSKDDNEDSFQGSDVKMPYKQDVVIVEKDNNEVDKPDKDGEVQGTGDRVPPLSVSGNIPDSERSSESPGQIPEEAQPRTQITNPPGRENQHRTC